MDTQEFKFDIYHLGVHLGHATHDQADPDVVKKYFVEEEKYPHDIVVCLVKDRS